MTSASPTKLIIASGDCSDADGFLTIPIYKETGADVIYFVNFSAIFNDECMDAILNPINPKNINTNIKHFREIEYPVYSPVEWAIPGYVHRGNWVDFYKNTFRDFSKYILIDKNFNKYLDNGKIKPEYFVPGSKEKEELKNAILNVFYELTYRLIGSIWEETKLKTNNKIYIVGWSGDDTNRKYHLNTVNPFALYLLSDDVNTYADIFKNDKNFETVVKLNGDRNIQLKPLDTLTSKTFKFDGNTYDSVYIDFNGSMAFYSHYENFMKNAFRYTKGVYMMGGVRTNEPPKTLSMFSIIRYACSTMNQVYHPENTLKFLHNINAQTPIYVVSNNYINDDANFDVWDMSGTNNEVEPRSIKKLFENHKNWIPNSPSLLKVLFAFYGEEAKPIKIFDVPVAMKLAMDIKKPPTEPIQATQNNLFIADRGVTLLSQQNPENPDNTEIKWKTVKENYIKQLSTKYHEKFKNSMLAEIEFIENLKYEKENSTNTPDVLGISCFVVDDVITGEIKTAYIQASNRKYETIADSIDAFNINVNTIFTGTTLPSPPSASANTTYDFTGKNILVFTDLEGGIPLSLKNEVITFLSSYSETNLEDNLVDKDHAIIYLGDLIDNSRNNITLMQIMLNLKEKSPKNVILIGGNRDFNKIRLADEHYIVYRNTTKKTPDEVPVIEHFRGKTLQEAVNTIMDDLIKNNYIIAKSQYQFKYTAEQLVDPAYKVKPWHVNNYALFNQPTFAGRVNRVYLDMYGIGTDAGEAVNVLFKEIVELGHITEPSYLKPNLSEAEKSNYDNYKAVTVTLFNMFASRVWKNAGKLFGTDTEKFNGLYVKYMNQCEICALFRQGDKYGFASHGGISNFEDYYTDVLGISYDLTLLKQILLPKEPIIKFEQTTLSNIIDSYNSFKDEALKPLEETSELVRSDPKLEHLIHMTATTKYDLVTDGGIVAHHALSPVLGYRSPPAGKKVKVKIGGINDKRKYLRLPRQTIKVAKLDDEAGTQLSWVIYGHQPRGIVPSVANKDGTFHICLDVSKIEGSTNDTSFAAMRIDINGNATIFGKVDFDQLIAGSSKTNTKIYRTSPTTSQTTLEYELELDKLVEIQSQAQKNIKFTENVVYKTEKTVKVDFSLLLSPVIRDNNGNDYFYKSEFLGACPAPIITNSIFVAPTTTSPIVQFGGGKRKRIQFSKMTLNQLKKYAKQYKIKGRSQMTREELEYNVKRAHKKLIKSK